MKSKKIIYIGGYGRSGSTFLDTELGKKINALSSGELATFLNEMEQHRLCSCGQLLPDCPMWGLLAKRYQGTDLARQKMLTRVFESSIFKNLRIGRMQTRFFSKQSRTDYFCLLRDFFDYALVENQYVIDSSKTAWDSSWRPLRLSILKYDVYFIHLYRPLFEVLKSVQMGTNKSLLGISSEKPLRVPRAIIGWSYANLVAFLYRFIFRRNYCFIRQVDLKNRQETVLEDLVAFILADEPPCSQAGGTHIVGGNRNKFNN